MGEYLGVISMLSFSILSVYLLSRIRMIPGHKIAWIERYGVYFKPLSPGVHFLIPFVDRLVLYDIERQLILNREIIEVNGEPKLSFSMNVQYRIVDERDYHEKNVDQFMRNTVLQVVQSYAERYGTLGISQQKMALQTRIKGIMMEKIVDWGIELSSIDVTSLSELPFYKRISS